MIKGYLRPSCLSQDLYHNVLCVDDSLEIGKLLILVVARLARNIINAVKDLHANNGVDIEEENEQWHETEYDGQYLEDYSK